MPERVPGSADAHAASGDGTRRAPGRIGAALIAAGLAVHAWFALGADALDSDRALVLLMARHFARGDLSLYFWRQNYMGALEPLLLAPFAWLGWATPRAAAAVGILITGALAAVSVALARRLGAVAWVALLLWALPPAVVAHHHVALYGARLLATLLVVAAFAFALRATSARAWIAAGALTGLAYFGDHIMLVWAVGIGYIAARRRRTAPFALGAVPLVALDTAGALLTPAVHLAGPNDPAGWLDNLGTLVRATLPQLFGLLPARAPGPLFEPEMAVGPRGALWVVCAVPGALALAAVIGTLVHDRRALLRVERGRTEEAPAALALVVVAGLGLFALIGGGGDRWSVRYLVPLWPAISLLAALAVARWPRLWRPAVAALALPALLTLATDPSWPRGGAAEPARVEAAAVGEALARSGARAVWADYWDAYRMALLVGESPPWATLRIIERRSDWAAAATEAHPVAYLVRRADAEVRDRIVAAERSGAARVVGIEEVGRYSLITTERSVPGLVLMNPPPSRARQRAAALAGALAFAAALAGAAGAARLGRSGVRAGRGHQPLTSGPPAERSNPSSSRFRDGHGGGLRGRRPRASCAGPDDDPRRRHD